MKTQFSVLNGDVVDVPSDILLLKHAALFYGADMAVATRLTEAGACSKSQLAVAPDDFVIVDTKGIITSPRVMFLGAGPLYSFGYPEMQRFAHRAVEILRGKGITVRRLTTTIHGAGYGLDAEESLQRLVAGFYDGLISHGAGEIREIVFVEAERRRAHLLTSALTEIVAKLRLTWAGSGNDRQPRDVTPARGNASEKVLPSADAVAVDSAAGKRHVFVAMPFSEDFEDAYEYGIYGPVRACGLICEKTSESAYTGDILQRIKDRIETADYVVAEMTGGRPNVYLEVGYAWGKGVPVIFLARSGEELHFDVSRHRCIYYKSIRQLAKDLEKLLRGLLDAS